MDILIAFLVVLGIALVLGVALAVLSHLFAVPEDPRFAQMRACLPGANCGACGFNGCDGYAAALAEGGIKPTLCTPGGQQTADQLSKLLGVEAEPFEDRVAFVACNGHCGAAAPKAVYDGVSTCQAAAMIYGGPNACRYGCLGFGDCARVCPNNAICMIDGIAHVDTSRCIGCRLCERTCPKQIIDMVHQDARTVVMCHNRDAGAAARKACQNACIGCKKCTKVCPHGAITVWDNLATIDYDKCQNCGACVEACPTGCLKSVYFPDLDENV